jgi:hypothetical protein
MQLPESGERASGQGDQIRLRGHMAVCGLRDDTGNGACETIYGSEVEVLAVGTTPRA